MKAKNSKTDDSASTNAFAATDHYTDPERYYAKLYEEHAGKLPPPPSVRHAQFVALDWPRKFVTIEPIMDFDVVPFSDMISACRPEYCWIGWNSRPGSVQLPEPSREKFVALVEELTRRGFELRGKDLRGIPLPPCAREISIG